MKMLKNLTPHEVKIITEEGTVVVKPSGVVARCNEHEELAGKLVGIPVTRLVLGDVVDLPSEEKDVVLIVSHIVLQACPKRKDLVKSRQIHSTLLHAQARLVLHLRVFLAGFC